MPGHRRIRRKRLEYVTRDILPGERYQKLRTVCKIKTNTTIEQWVCECECGKLTKTTKHDWLRKARRSCGCSRVEDKPLVEKVKDIPTKVYQAWKGAKSRNILSKQWLDPKIFYRDVGDPPSQFAKILRRDTSKKLSKLNWYWGGMAGVELEIVR